MAPGLAALKGKRANTRAAILRVKAFLDGGKDPLPEEVQCRISLLEAYFKQFMGIQDQIFNCDDATEADKAGSSEIEDIYCSTKARLLALMEDKKRQHSIAPGDQSQFEFQQIFSNSFLPKVKLPSFSGRAIEYTNFIKTFELAVNQQAGLPNVAKFLHLRNCLSGEAFQTIEPLEVNAENYLIALKLLEERYGNKYLNYQSHLKRISEVTPVTRPTVSNLRALIDTVNANVKALETYGNTEDILNGLLIHLAKAKLDSISCSRWEESIDHTKLPSWEDFSKFINNRCQYLSTQEAASSEQRGGVSAKSAPKASRGMTFTTSRDSCAKCKSSDHHFGKCGMILSLPVSQRFNEAKRLRLCINCLRGGHSVQSCSSSSCRVCSQRHHTMLHRYNSSTNAVSPASASNINNSSPANVLHTIAGDPTSNQVVLATAVVLFQSRTGQYVPARVLLDSASQLNFVTQQLAQRLNLKRTHVSAEITGIGDLRTNIRASVSVSIKSRVNTYSRTLSALLLPKITGDHPEFKFNVECWELPSSAVLADPQFNLPQGVDALLGADIFYDSLRVGQIQLAAGLPVLQETLFGWVVAGALRSNLNGNRLCSHIAVDQEDIVSTRHISDQIERFWSMEEVDVPCLKWTKEQVECERHFQGTVRRDVNGRFILRLPFKRDPKELGESRATAEKAFLRLESKLAKDLKLKQMYVAFMREYMSLGHMTPASGETTYFIPHHPVIRLDSSSTKLRVVFDASSPTTSLRSLNDLLSVGPTIQSDLFCILIRFRCRRYAVSADIVKMFRQILIDPQDTRYLSILWREDPSHPLQILSLLTVVYGTACAPHQAVRCLVELARLYQQQYPTGSRVLLEDFYVDNLLSGADTQDELLLLTQEIVSLLAEGKFELRKWSTNSPVLLRTIPDEHQEPALMILNDSALVKTLGLLWNPTADNFTFTWKGSGAHHRITKRTVLAETASLFDPLGVLSPLIVIAKTILQRLWSLKIAWDEPLPEDIRADWLSCRSDLCELHRIQIGRYLYAPDYQSCEIHGFSDASKSAYGCCAYLRSIDSNGDVSVQLIAAKSRVAPLKTQSLPRLELCAALLLTELMNKVKVLLKPSKRVVMWTDSEIVLHWDNGSPNSWTTFVSNRVSKILQSSEVEGWRHVGSKSNPADIVSRGSTVSELLASTWFSGPPFLLQEESEWPEQKSWGAANTTIPDQARTHTTLTASASFDIIATHKFANNYPKLIRIFGYISRFISAVYRRLKLRGPLSNIEAPSSIAASLDEISSDGRNSRTSSLQSLCPYMDGGSPSLLRVGGRLIKADLPYEAKNPILLPKNHPFCLAYLSDLHRKLLHCGCQSLIANCRQRFWIVNLKAAANWVVRKCAHCFHYKPKLIQQVMAHLPRERVSPAPPFSTCGVDLCGPIWTSFGARGRARRKSYIALFVCFATHAVHLEVVSDLTTSTFLAALKRFVSRRGRSSDIFCDNATNFVGARNKLIELHEALFSEQAKSSIANVTADDRINFHFIPPRAPHFGGLWEAGVKAAKHHLLRVLHATALTFEELSTVSCLIEAILNSRPLGAMSSDPNDEEALTPAHFLIGRSLTAVPEPDWSSQNMGALHRWQQLSALQQHFWARWTREYLPQLQQRHKWNRQSPNAEVNMLVLIADDQAPPQKWLLGRIIEVHAGTDGHVRVADVRTKLGVVRRAIHKLAPLPLATHC